MKYKTFARVCLKLLGVYFASTGFISLTSDALRGLQVFRVGGSFAPPYNWLYIANIFADGIQVGLGVYFFLGGEWVVNKIIPSNRPYCHDCGYDLSHNRSPQCAECGSTVRAPGV